MQAAASQCMMLPVPPPQSLPGLTVVILHEEAEAGGERERKAGEGVSAQIEDVGGTGAGRRTGRAAQAHDVV